MIIIFGLGFTGQRVARRLLNRNLLVAAVVRGTQRFAQFADLGLILREWDATRDLPQGARVLNTIPPLDSPDNALLREKIIRLRQARVVYVSSTGVYGAQSRVDENSPVAPIDQRGFRRVDEEEWIRSCSWSSLILRAAAIYGPGRGVHKAVREGRIPRGSGIVSRIHVEDLAALIEAALFSETEEAWPVGDDRPCSSEEIIQWCAGESANAPRTGVQISGRKVDGRKIRELLGVELLYPSWETGVPASIAEERAAQAADMAGEAAGEKAAT